MHPSVLEETGSHLGFHITPPSHSPSCQAGWDCPGEEPEAPPHQGLGAAWGEPLLEQPTPGTPGTAWPSDSPSVRPRHLPRGCPTRGIHVTESQ